MSTTVKSIDRGKGKCGQVVKKECKCLRCAKPTVQKHDGEILLICGDMACNMKCTGCLVRPGGTCNGFRKYEEEAAG